MPGLSSLCCGNVIMAPVLHPAATVGMEQATLTVMEGNIRPVFVCVNVTTPDISCPVDFDFDITFSVNGIYELILSLYWSWLCSETV